MIDIEYLTKFNEIKGHISNMSLDLNDLWNPQKKLVKKTTFDYRTEYTKKYAWAIPTEEALREIAKYSPLIEIGAGGGYWAYLLHQLGGDIVCFDLEPYENYQVDCKWHEVKRGTPEILLKYPHRNLFLCWPPYDDDMGDDCLKYFKGIYIIYIGEGEGGCNLSDEAWGILDTKYDEIEHNGYIPQWYGLHDHLYIFKRKEVEREDDCRNI